MKTEEATAIVPQTTDQHQLIQYEPRAVLSEAAKAAAALKDVIDKKPRKVVMGGEQYLEFEDWQTVGRFYGITPAAEGEPTLVRIETAEKEILGFKATSVALDKTGRVLSRATAYCMNDEEKWSSRPRYEWHYKLREGGTSAEDPGPEAMVWEPNPNKPGKSRPAKVRVLAGVDTVPIYQLASMAQTRANAKVMRNVLSWVVVLAGYKTTPAEEMDSVPGAHVIEAEVVTPPKPVVTEEEIAEDVNAVFGPPEGIGAPPPEEPPSRSRSREPMPQCPQCQTPTAVMKAKYNPERGSYYCKTCKTQFS